MSVWGLDAVTSGSAAMGTASSQVLASNPDRRWLRVTNLGPGTSASPWARWPLSPVKASSYSRRPVGRTLEMSRGGASLWSGAGAGCGFGRWISELCQGGAPPEANRCGGHGSYAAKRHHAAPHEGLVVRVRKPAALRSCRLRAPLVGRRYRSLRNVFRHLLALRCRARVQGRRRHWRETVRTACSSGRSLWRG